MTWLFATLGALAFLLWVIPALFVLGFFVWVFRSMRGKPAQRKEDFEP